MANDWEYNYVMARRSIISWVFDRRSTMSDESIEYIRTPGTGKLSPIDRGADSYAPIIVDNNKLLDKQYNEEPQVVEVGIVKDVWIAIHNERKIRVTGRLKQHESHKHSVSGEQIYSATLDDGTGIIRIYWKHKPVLSGNPETTYSVLGTCRSEDGIRTYLDDCIISVISIGRSASAAYPREPLAYDVQSKGAFPGEAELNIASSGRALRYIDDQESGKKSLVPKGDRTGANWTKRFDGMGVRADSNWQYWRNLTFKRDGYNCVQCQSKENLTVDHIQPLSLGGKNELKNLQTLCGDCHEDKHYRKFLDKKFDATDDYGANHKPTNKILAIIKAIDNKAKVRIDYIDRKGIKSTRLILPSRLYKGYYYQGKSVCINCVYVDAYCYKDNDNRTFRLSRMKAISSD